MSEHPEIQLEALGELLKMSLADRVTHLPPNVVTREEMRRELSNVETRLETKLELAMANTRNWVLGGMLGSAALFGGGFYTMVSKLDRVAEAVPQLESKVAQRRTWIERQERSDANQDAALKKLEPAYQPLPYEALPE